jgi:hypothetical protein
MSRTTVLRATLALVLGVSVTTMGTPAPTATAATIGRYRTQPAGTPQALVNLGLAVTVSAGTTRLVSSYLVVGNAGQLTAVSHLVYCRVAGSSTVTQRIVTGQNVTRGTRVVLLTRGLVTAPATRALTCQLYAVLINHASTRVYGTINVLAGTSLRLSAPIHSSAQVWQYNKALVNSSYAAAPVRFTARATATSIQAIGDVNVTVCYPGDNRGACLGRGSRRSASYAYVGTQLVVRPLQASGAVCRTYVSGPLAGTRITWEIHHRKLNLNIINIPVSSSCTSRRFSAYVRVTANRRANSVVVENNHQSETALYVRP